MAQVSGGVEVPVWHRIRLSRDEVESGELTVLLGAFRACYFAGNGPRGMAMLGEHETGGQGAYLVYFTPASLPHAAALVKAYSAKPQEPPRRRGLNVIYGDPAEAWLAVRAF